jgi:hypothetical protein
MAGLGIFETWRRDGFVEVADAVIAAKTGEH